LQFLILVFFVFLVVRYDKPVARIVPEGQRNKRRAAAAVDGLLVLQRRIAKRVGGTATLTEADVRAAIEEGRE
jgi:antitoxin (DNA-binding transcriptional repressor) of toxin-antitoxin stability system